MVLLSQDLGKLQVNYSRDSLITPFGLETLRDRYLLPGETSPQDAFSRAALAYSDDLAHAQRIYDYASKLWFMFSTPILSNAGSTRGLSISCFLSYVGDSRAELTDHYKENAFLASVGGGVSGYWGDVRSDGTSTSSGSRSTGSVPFMKVIDAEVLAFSQGRTRRGSYALYQNIDHPEIEEFIHIRRTTGGDLNRKCLNLHNGVNITDKFMEAVTDDLDWNLIDPHTKKVTKTLKARYLWEMLLESRVTTGEPYIHFIDASNRHRALSHKILGLDIKQSNLCVEILEPTNEERTAVCCLSSVNLEYYDEWKDNALFIEDIVRFLDNSLQAFIENAPPELHKAVYSASRERSLGLGAMGFHSYLQKQSIPFEGPIAIGVNKSMFSLIKAQALTASEKLAEEKGQAPDILEADGEKPRRNVYLMAIAPNASSSIICGETSPSIEPLRANAFTQKTMSGSFLVKNKHLEKVLEDKGQNNKEIWQSIMTNSGSVAHLEFLTDWEREVFRTGIEIDQNWILQHASDRQPYICQSQSVNLFLPADVSVRYLNQLHLKAWKLGLKTLYYVRSMSLKRNENVSEKVVKNQRPVEDECFGCSG